MQLLPMPPHSLSPFSCSGVLSSNQSLHTFFHPILRHFLNAPFNSSRSFASKRSFCAAFKSSRDAIAGISTSGDRYRLRSGPKALRLGDRPPALRLNQWKESVTRSNLSFVLLSFDHVDSPRFSNNWQWMTLFPLNFNPKGSPKNSSDSAQHA